MSSIETRQPLDDIHQLQAWANARQARDESWGNPPPAAESAPQAIQEKIIKERKISLGKTAIACIAGGLVVVAGGVLVVGASFFSEANAAGKAVVAEQIAAKGGKATEQSLSFVIPPFTMATAASKTVVNLDLNSKIFNVQLPPLQSIERQDLITTQYDVSLDKVTANYDFVHKVLSYNVPNGAVTVEELINTDAKDSQIDLPIKTNLFQDLIKIGQDADGNAVHVLADLKNLSADKNHQITAADIPLVGGLANGSMTTTSVLEKIADKYAQVENNQVCVPAIASKGIFVSGLSKNIVNLGRLKLFDDKTQKENLTNNLSVLMALPSAERDKIINNATVTFASDFAHNIHPDPTLKASLDNYVNLGLFSTKGAKFTCDTSAMTVYDASGKVIKQ